MGYRKFRLTKRKNAKQRRLSSRNLKTIAGRPSKHQKKYIQRANTAAVTEEVCRTIECIALMFTIYTYAGSVNCRYTVSFKASLKQMDGSIEESIK